MITRRTLLATGAGLAAAQELPKLQLKGRLKQGVTRGVFGKGMSFEDMCKNAARLGVKGFDLVGPKDWPTVKQNGLIPTMCPGAGSIETGLNRPELHEKFLADFKQNITLASEAGCPNVICMSGTRKGMPDAEGMENCAVVLKKIAPFAEEKNVTICMELLNSKVNHPDYMCDHTAWGAALCKKVGSPRVKLLYDIYHMQIMEGDIIRTIRENIAYIGHFHTAGNPGRHEMDNSQELFYPPIAKAVLDTGYTGYFSHEYSPTKDPLKTLEQMLLLCDV
jgi:hydroxypyruvate isomerase